MIMTVAVGQEAPDFTLRSTQGEITLSQFRGQKAVALVFYPFSFTAVCEGELCALRDDFSVFEEAGVQVLAVSCDTAPAQALWAERNGWTFPVLTDFWPHGAVAQAYGVFNEQRGCAMRATFLIDSAGVLVDSFETPDLATPRTMDRYKEALTKL